LRTASHIASAPMKSSPSERTKGSSETTAAAVRARPWSSRLSAADNRAANKGSVRPEKVSACTSGMQARSAAARQGRGMPRSQAMRLANHAAASMHRTLNAFMLAKPKRANGLASSVNSGLAQWSR
jgi:hypothetical protein